MHETSEYYCYINLCNLESDTLVYLLFLCKHNIFTYLRQQPT